MKQPTTISIRPLSPKTLDYDYLYNLAIRYLQELSGDIWSDYNVHDPGVTILEYLCYAITDLGYRTNLSVEDLLYAKYKGKAEDLKNTLFPPEQIYPSAALTSLDYRKWLLDSVPEIQDCWLEKDNPMDSQKGLNQIFIQLHDDVKNKEQIAQNVKNLLAKHRNIGEDFSTIQFLEKQKIQVVARILIRYNTYAESVMIDILMALEEFFSHTVHHQEREEVWKEGTPLSKLYDGPFLKNGYIANADLTPRRRIVHLDEIKSILLDVDGVLNVMEIYLRQNSRTTDDQVLTFQENQYPVFDKDFLTSPKAAIPIKLEKQGDIIPLDSVEVKRIFSSKISAINHRVTEDDSLETVKPTSDLSLEDIAFYSSIQKLFPHIYGITAWGVPLRAPQAQKVKAKQLKAYLILFEQFFSTYLAELSHLNSFFSIEQKPPQHPFPFFPKDVPDVLPIIQSADKEQADTEDIFAKVDATIKAKFLETSKPLQKKNALLSHLMARFNETFPEEQYAAAYNEVINDKIRAKIIALKTNFLQNYPSLSRDRGLGLDTSEPAWETDNVSGLKKRICALLGFESVQNKSLVKSMSNGKRVKKAPLKKENSSTLTAPQIPVFDLMIYGADAIFYHITEVNEGENKGGYQVEFCPPSISTPIKVYESESYEKSEQAIKNLIAEVEVMNQNSTGFFIVDHVLLRKRNRFEWGLYLYDQDFKLLLQNTAETALATLKIISYNVLLVGSQDANYELKGNQQEGYQIILYDEKKTPILTSPTKLTHEEAQQQKKKIHQLLNTIKNEDPAKISEFLFLQKRTEVEHGQAYTVPTNFFNFQLSFIFPKWLKRFFNREHRAFVKNLILENIPAHLRANFYWLSIGDMQTFEELYENWLNLLPNADQKPHELERASSELVKFLVETEK